MLQFYFLSCYLATFRTPSLTNFRTELIIVSDGRLLHSQRIVHVDTSWNGLDETLSGTHDQSLPARFGLSTMEEVRSSVVKYAS